MMILQGVDLPAVCAKLVEDGRADAAANGFFLCFAGVVVIWLLVWLLLGTMSARARTVRRYERALHRRADQYVALGMSPTRAIDLAMQEMQNEAAAALGVVP